MIGVLHHINEKEKAQSTPQLPQPRVVWNIDDDLTTSHLEYLDEIKGDLSRHLPQNNQSIPWQQQPQGEEWNRDWHLHRWNNQPHQQLEDNEEEGAHRGHLQDWRQHQNEQQHRQQRREWNHHRSHGCILQNKEERAKSQEIN